MSTLILSIYPNLSQHTVDCMSVNVMVKFKLLIKGKRKCFLCHNYRKRILNVSKAGQQAKQADRVIEDRPVSDQKMNVSAFQDNSIQFIPSMSPSSLKISIALWSLFSYYFFH